VWDNNNPIIYTDPTGFDGIDSYYDAIDVSQSEEGKEFHAGLEPSPDEARRFNTVE